MNMATLEVKICHSYPGFNLDVDLQLPATGVTAIMGPSGSGKTSLLRCLAGLTRPQSACLSLGDEVWQDVAAFVPVHQRNIGVVFQQPSLFEHLTVEKNIEYGAKRCKRSDDEGITAVVALLGLDKLLQRMPQTLSGGEQQRVAIARALAAQPAILLLDEPLAALDDTRKAEIMPFLDKLHRSLNIPLILVSHAIDEVARLADHLVLIDEGKVQASGPLHSILSRLDLPTASHAHAKSVIETTVVSHDENFGLSYLGFVGGQFVVPYTDTAIGQNIRLQLEARDVSITLQRQSDTSILNIFAATLVEDKPDGIAQQLLRLELGSVNRGELVSILARISRKSLSDLGLTRGQQVFVQIKSIAVLR